MESCVARLFPGTLNTGMRVNRTDITNVEAMNNAIYRLFLNGSLVPTHNVAREFFIVSVGVVPYYLAFVFA